MMAPIARLLALLDLDALTELADALGLDAPESASETELHALITAEESATLRAVLAALPRETLKHACKALALPGDGRGRAVFVRRLVEALGQSAEAPTRTLQVEVYPRGLPLMLIGAG